METISVVLSVQNEEAKIERTLASIQWADEIIVVDNESTDKTVRLAKQYGANVFHHKNSPMLNVSKNFGFTKVKSDWILSLDGDEVIPPELAHEIQQITHADIVGYWIPRKNILFGKWIQHGLWWPDKQLRLFKRGLGGFPCKHVHEYLSVDGLTSELTSSMVHYNYETVSQFIRKMDEIYTVSEVENHLASGYRVIWYDAIRFPMSDFVKTFLAQRGFKDGLHGLVLSLLQAFYSFIVFVKLWEREKFIAIDLPIEVMDKEMVRAGGEVRYWMLSVKISQTVSSMKKLWYRILRKYATYR
ncbi:MAG: glycosyltransferase family 2 protein [Patescibacteria group bacterium]